MARSRRGGSVMSRPAPARPAARPASTHAAPAAPAPQPSAVPAPMQSSSGGGMLSGIGSTIAQGMAFGTGSAIAHRAVGAVAGSFGGGSSEQPQATAAAPEYAQGAMPAAGQAVGQPDVCAMDKQMFYECLGQNKGDQQACQFLYDQLKQCQQSATHFG